MPSAAISSSSQGRPSPLLIALHGGGGSGEQMERFGGFDEIADSEGFVVVYPDGVGHNWNDGRDADFSKAHANQIDDVGFIAAVIDATSSGISVDPDRVFATGISNGAMMSIRLACDLAKRIAAIGPVAGSGPEDLMPRCQPARPISVLMINGTSDPLVPYEGGPVAAQTGERGRVWPVERTADFWATSNGCTGELTPEALPDVDKDDGSAIRRRVWIGCKAAVSVQLLTVVGGGHTWPGRAQYLPPLVIGPTNRDLDASRYIWSFLSAHPMTTTAPR